jgi:hypothetical protein
MRISFSGSPLLPFRWALQSGQHGFAPCHDNEPRAIGHGALTNPWTVRASDRELLQQVADFSRQLAIAGQSEKEDDVA